MRRWPRLVYDVIPFLEDPHRLWRSILYSDCAAGNRFDGEEFRGLIIKAVSSLVSLKGKIDLLIQKAEKQSTAQTRARG